MKEFTGNKALFILGIMLVIILLIVGTAINIIGKMMFPDYWNKGLSFLCVIGLLLTIIYLLDKKSKSNLLDYKMEK